MLPASAAAGIGRPSVLDFFIPSLADTVRDPGSLRMTRQVDTVLVPNAMR